MTSRLPSFTRTQHHHHLQIIPGTCYHCYLKLNTISVKIPFCMEKEARENLKQNATITGIKRYRDIRESRFDTKSIEIDISRLESLDTKCIMQSLL